jgi:hypothetical protein
MQKYKMLRLKWVPILIKRKNGKMSVQNQCKQEKLLPEGLKS